MVLASPQYPPRFRHRSRMPIHPKSRAVLLSIFAVTILCATTTRAQYLAPQSWTTQDGLPQNSVHAITQTLRLELAGSPVRVTEVCPGMVQTDFALNRLDGDQERAAAVYRGMDPLTPEDVADVVAFAVTRPGRVNLDQIVMRPLRQASAYKQARQG